MKKILHTLLVAAIGLTASAQTTFDGSTLYGYCSNPKYATTLTGNVTLGVAMQLNAATIKQFKGCKITAIAVANGISDDKSITSVPLKLFVGETTTEDYMQEFTGEMNFNESLQYKEYPLTEAITISEDTPELFFGYIVDCQGAKYQPLVTDAKVDKNAGPGDYIGMYSNGKWSTWQQLREQIGMPCIRLKIEGDELLANSVAICEHYLPTYTIPGGKAQVGIYVINNALNTVESVKLTPAANGEEGKTVELKLPTGLLNNEIYGPLVFDMDMPDVVGNDLPVSVTVSGVNADAANNASSSLKTASTMYLSLAEGFDKAVVVEEATGTWCGWCPIGIVGLEKMAETHSDDPLYVPIAAHYNDAMSIASYAAFFGGSYTGGSFPTCMVNRNKETFGVQKPSYAFLQEAFTTATKIPAVCKVDIKDVSFDAVKKRLNVEAEAEFAIPTSGDYGFSYIITEDHVGPYSQSNNYSGSTLEWWGEQKSLVSNVYYDHVVRYANTFKGISGSIPADVVAATKYGHSAQLQTNSVKNIENCQIIVMVVNRETGRIENAIRAPYSNYSAINEVKVGENAQDGAWYDLQGRKVTNPGRGLYIHDGHKQLNP
ncbi:MAG: hypothetical protein NC301_03395 [Bacteroides sp.]|nr:hypothetical protein [Bacteroides sp.]MCM1379181.1 hypothetical protein [Bacteroides sp.]MCM1445170.1 hypothetical protein [Prevotella sp.]